MDNSNIIISVIIVLCIAAGVTAYGISEGNNAVFNDLTGFTPDSSDSGDTGVDQTGTDTPQTTDTGAPADTGSSSSGSSSSGSSGGSSSSSGSSGGTNTNGGSNSGSGSNGGSGNGGSGSGGNTPSSNKISADQAKSIASGFIGEAGAYVSSVKDDGSEYICYISDSNGTVVDAIAISYSGANLGRA